jgi:hypothetical protein
MAKVTLRLTNLSGRDLNRSGYSGTGNWTPSPPAYMSNGLAYGPIYLYTGTLFHVEVGYKLNPNLSLGVGNENFVVEMFTNPSWSEQPSLPPNVYAGGYGLFFHFKAIPRGYGVSFATDKTPYGFEVSLTYQGSGHDGAAV